MADIEKVIKELDRMTEDARAMDLEWAIGIDDFATLCEALELLKEQPQIVRCKDCKYVECEGVEGFLVCDISGFSHLPEFFCADGERKET